MSEQLKPCAHCGAPAQWLGAQEDHEFQTIGCSDDKRCGVYLVFDSDAEGSAQKAIEKWNRRRAPDRVEEAVPWAQVEHLMAMLVRIGLVKDEWFETWHPELHERFGAALKEIQKGGRV